MKKTLIISTLLAAGAVGALAQGTIIFSDQASGFKIHIYQPQTQNPTVEVTGNAANDLPAGSTVYDTTVNQAAGGPVGGASTGTGLGNGNNITVQLYAAPGNVVSGGLAGLSPVSQYIDTAFTTAGGTGLFKTPTISGDPGIPNTGTDTTDPGAGLGATVSLVAWFNAGGTITSFANATTKGFSPLVYIATLGGYTAPGGTGPGPSAPPTGVTSFSLTSVPEPSTIALGVIGAAGFLFRRRK